MNKRIRLLENKPERKSLPEWFNKGTFEKVGTFHKTLKDYRETPLVALNGLAGRLGVKGVYVKDESNRFGLKAFKGLGASYAISKILAQHRGNTNPVFVTATDGNHGKAVAWAAAQEGCRAVVFMPKGSKECRVEAIRSIGNTIVEVTEMNYDDTVRHAYNYALKHGYYLVQDTGFEGYEEIPQAITLGYTTMAAESIKQLQLQGIKRPTHVFLQAGVGSMAGGVLGYLADYFGEDLPQTTIMEADDAACIFESVKSGTMIAIGGHPETIMAGLNCGEANVCTYPVLKDFASWFAACPDWVTEQGMCQLAHPEPGDQAIISGESGAVGLGLLMSLCENGEYGEFKEKMGLDENSIILLFSTEGDTDPENYQRIINREKNNDE